MGNFMSPAATLGSIDGAMGGAGADQFADIDDIGNKAVLFCWGSRRYRAVNDRDATLSATTDLMVNVTGIGLTAAQQASVADYRSVVCLMPAQSHQQMFCAGNVLEK